MAEMDIYIVGQPGVGKSTLLKKIKPILEEMDVETIKVYCIQRNAKNVKFDTRHSELEWKK